MSDDGLLDSVKDAVGIGDEEEATPAPGAPEEPATTEDPAVEGSAPFEDRPQPDGVEPGLTGLLLRAGDRLAWFGDRWEARVKDEPTRHPTPPPPEVFVGTFTFRGREVPWDMHEWGPSERRGGSLLAAGLASGLVLLGIVVGFFAPAASWFYTTLLVGVVVLMAFELAIFLTEETPPEASAEAAAAGGAAHGAWGEPEPPAEEEAPEEEPEETPDGDDPLDILTLKCSECSEVFDVEDHGERPLTHTCPGCGADGEIPASELPDPADLRDEEPEDDASDEPEAPAGEIPEETADPIPEFNLDDEDEETT